MATVQPTWVSDSTDANARLFTWVITQADTGGAVNAPGLPDKTVQVVGTFGGTTVIIEGSNDGGTTYSTLHDPQGSDLSFTVTGIKLIMENPQLIRPRASGGAGASVTVGITGVRN